MRKVLIPGIFGGLVAFIWLLVSNAIIPVKSEMIHMVAPNQMAVHSALMENITEPGTYAVPYIGVERELSVEEYLSLPVYSVVYTGYTHGDPGSPLDFIIPIVLVFGVSFVAAGMLRMASPQVVSSFGRRLLFVGLIGLLVALSDDLLQIYMGPQPKNYLIFLAVNNLITWFLMGLAIAWKTRPEPVA